MTTTTLERTGLEPVNRRFAVQAARPVRIGELFLGPHIGLRDRSWSGLSGVIPACRGGFTDLFRLNEFMTFCEIVEHFLAVETGTTLKDLVQGVLRREVWFSPRQLDQMIGCAASGKEIGFTRNGDANLVLIWTGTTLGFAQVEFGEVGWCTGFSPLDEAARALKLPASERTPNRLSRAFGGYERTLVFFRKSDGR